MSGKKIAENYLYWQENGLEWVHEYEERKHYQIRYHLQEIMLAEYLSRCAPVRVLEFGCGIGRHLQYLSTIPGIEIYGYDQSHTMLQGVKAWASDDWIKEHVVLGAPTGTLPYADKSFDIVYSAEVLIHSRPQDLPGILKEMMRLARWQVFHFEPSPTFKLVQDAHSGCWRHDFPYLYASLGYECEILSPGFESQTMFRVMLDASRAIPRTYIPFSKFRDIEEYIQPHLDRFPGMMAELEQNQSAINDLRLQVSTREQQVAGMQIENIQLKQQTDEVQAERNRLMQQAAEMQAEVAQLRQQVVELQQVNLVQRQGNDDLQDRLLQSIARIEQLEILNHQLTSALENYRQNLSRVTNMENELRSLL